jgi:carboxylesterase type B
VGELRWAKPVRPTFSTKLQSGDGQQCVQGPISLALLPQAASLTESLNRLDGGSSEDCLFLDMVVPGSAIRAGTVSKLPVVVWIYGGAFSKYIEDCVLT